jgi:hypothetical protein
VTSDITALAASRRRYRLRIISPPVWPDTLFASVALVSHSRR